MSDLIPTPDDLTLPEIMLRFADETASRAYLEAIRWPDGIVCPRCGNDKPEFIWEIKQNKAKGIRAGMRQCAACKKQFTVTVGTIFESSKIPLGKWLIAWYLLSSSKKGISSLQIKRILDLGSYRTALFMMHRIRHALRDPVFSDQLKGTVEADETYVGGKAQPGTPKYENKSAVMAMVERGGRVRSKHLDAVNVDNLKRELLTNVALSSTLNTDELKAYKAVGRHYALHLKVNHSRKEYVRGEAYTNTVEGVFALLKRGIIGTFHSVSKKHLQLYLAEFDFRWNHRKVTDGARTVEGLKKAEGKRLTYKPMIRGKKS